VSDRGRSTSVRTPATSTVLLMSGSFLELCLRCPARRHPRGVSLGRSVVGTFPLQTTDDLFIFYNLVATPWFPSSAVSPSPRRCELAQNLDPRRRRLPMRWSSAVFLAWDQLLVIAVQLLPGGQLALGEGTRVAVPRTSGTWPRRPSLSRWFTVVAQSAPLRWLLSRRVLSRRPVSARCSRPRAGGGATRSAWSVAKCSRK